MKAISDFVKAWDSLPVGKHSPQAIQDWLNNPEMISAVKELKRLSENETGAAKTFRSLVDEAAFGKEWAGGHFESEIIAQVERLRQYYLDTLYRKYNIPVTEQGLDPVKLREAARNLEDS